jgi:hypothetical protein
MIKMCYRREVKAGESFRMKAFELQLAAAKIGIEKSAPAVAAAPQVTQPPVSVASARPPLTNSTSAPSSPSDDNSTWVSLFNGKDLSGWRIIGDSRGFTVDQGNLRTGGVRADLIYTGTGSAPAIFGDFELRMKVKTGDKGNSGLWFHLPTGIQDTRECDQSLQVQIDNGFDKQRTGSIVHIVPLDQSPVADGEWFELRVVVQNGTVTSFVDGKQVNQWTQPSQWQPPSKAALAKMGTGAIGLESWKGMVWFQDIQLRTLSDSALVSKLESPRPTAADDWQPLFPTNTLAGWTGDVAGYRIANGILTSTDKGGDLISPKEYGGFHLKFDLRLTVGANNGIGVWCADNKGPYNFVGHTGFEIQLIDDNLPTYTKGDPWHLHGALSYFLTPKAKPMGLPGSWNSHELRIEGTHITLLINDKIVLDEELPRGDPVSGGSRRHRLDFSRQRGHLVFCGMKGPVEFRNVMIRDLDEEKKVVINSTVPTASPSLWVDAKNRTLQAKFVRLEGVTVRLNIGGKVTPVAMASLSSESQQIARDLQNTATQVHSQIPSDSLSFGTSRYAYFSETVTWQEAKLKAERLGGHLATVTSAAEDAWVIANFESKVSPGKKQFWIGAKQENPSQPWRWVTGEPFSFVQWAPSEPNNAKGTDLKSIPPYMLGYLVQGGRMGWNDFSESQANWRDVIVGYLVEWDGASPASVTAPPSAATPTPASAEDGFIDLFAATEQKEWRQCGKGGITFQNSVGTTWFPGGGFLGVAWYAKRTFKDFIWKTEFRVTQAQFNSGLRLRFPSPGTDPKMISDQGYEVAICDSTPGGTYPTASIHGVQTSTTSPLKPQGEWNSLEVEVVGQSYTVTLNGQVVNRFTGTRRTEGHIGIENHNRGPVQFRNVRVKPLP